jgi:Mce-associated membrane protein
VSAAGTSVGRVSRPLRHVAAALVAATLVLAGCSDDEPAPQSGEGASADANAELIVAGEQAEESAIEAVTRMTTYDFRTLDADFGWVDELGTDTFQENYLGASEQTRQVITELKASATGEVVDSAPKVLSATEVRVLLFVDQRIRARGSDQVRLDQPRVAMTMVREGDDWLVDTVTIDELVAQ